MKTALIISTLIIIFLGWVVFDLKTDNSIKEHDLEMRVKASKDSANLIHELLLKTKDSLEISFATIRSLNEQKNRAHEEARKAIEYANSLKFVRFKNDVQRDSILNVLYPR